MLDRLAERAGGIRIAPVIVKLDRVFAIDAGVGHYLGASAGGNHNRQHCCRTQSAATQACNRFNHGYLHVAKRPNPCCPGVSKALSRPFKLTDRAIFASAAGIFINTQSTATTPRSLPAARRALSPSASLA